ncbi:unnamed protein product [Caenorhabditis auriculariae]|uniref:PIG-P domain-containing protein n=1 Tax=Caenorhabditis auriculariae TaxID=2777116 RepID=A0A8S1HRX3_9PELO|nr:unnamed protein product [Caenorhabditis auriculariae]
MPSCQTKEKIVHVKNPLPSEDIHLPGPHPARGIYGFALYVSSYFLLFVYLLWAILPTPVLNRLGITYVPAKYWAIVLPFSLVFSVCAYVTVVFFINLYRFGGYSIFDNVGVYQSHF